MSDDQKLFTDQADLLLQVLNQQRHDWLNHVQVLLGYLRLGRPEEGEAYLKRVTEETRQESLIARINCPLLSVFFLTFNALHNDLRLETEVCDHVDLRALKADSYGLFRLVTGLVFAVRAHRDGDPLERESLLVSIAPSDGAVRIRFDFAGRLRASARPEVEKLVDRGRAMGALVTKYIEAQDEWVLEMEFPCRT